MQEWLRKVSRETLDEIKKLTVQDIENLPDPEPGGLIDTLNRMTEVAAKADKCKNKPFTREDVRGYSRKIKHVKSEKTKQHYRVPMLV